MQEQIQAQLAEILKNALAAPGHAPQWMVNQGKKQVNSSYDNILPGIERNLAKRGFETSGKMGGAARDVEIGRANSMQDLRAQLSQYADQRFQQMLQYAMQFQKPEGSNITGTQTAPSQLGGAIAGFGGDIATMLNLRNLQHQGTGGGGGGGFMDHPGGSAGGDKSGLLSQSPNITLPGKTAQPAGTPSFTPSSATSGDGSPQPLTGYKLPPMDEVWNQVFGPSAYKPLWRPEPMGAGAGGGY